MKYNEILLVKRSWRLLRNIDPAVIGETFYGKLFSDQPALRRLFPKDMSLQYQKLVDMLNTILAQLDNMEDINREIALMGQRHVIYGVKPAHYKMVGRAFLWMLEQGLGADFTSDVKQAWSNCYQAITDQMLSRPERVQ